VTGLGTVGVAFTTNALLLANKAEEQISQDPPANVKPEFIAKMPVMIKASFVCIYLGIKTALVDMHSEDTSFCVHR
jgi:hypothetical protein